MWPTMLPFSMHVSASATSSTARTLAKLEQSLIQATATAQLPTADVGIGIVNIDRRIKLLFGEQYGVTLQVVRDVGTTVSLHLPYQYAEAVLAQETQGYSHSI